MGSPSVAQVLGDAVVGACRSDDTTDVEDDICVTKLRLEVSPSSSGRLESEPEPPDVARAASEGACGWMNVPS